MDNELPLTPGGMMDQIAEEEGFIQSEEPASPMPESTLPTADHSVGAGAGLLPQENDYVTVLDGDREIRLPKSAVAKLSTKNGETMDIPVGEWVTSPWSKKEASRLVNEKIALEKRYQALSDSASNYKDIAELTSESAKEFRGAEWTAQALKAIYNMDPSRGPDIQEFIDAVQSGGLSEDKLKQSELQRKNLSLEQKSRKLDHQEHFAQLNDYTQNISNHLVSSLNMSPQELRARVSELARDGAVPQISDAESANQAANAIYNHILVDKALDAGDSLGLTPQEFQQYQGDMMGMLIANPRQSSGELAQKLSSLLGKGSAHRGQAKVESYRGRRTENSAPKPPLHNSKNDREVAKLSPFDFIERTTGHSYN